MDSLLRNFEEKWSLASNSNTPPRRNPSSVLLSRDQEPRTGVTATRQPTAHRSQTKTLRDSGTISSYVVIDLMNVIIM